MQIFVGTSGYSYKEWKGSFYPEKLPAAKMLEFYAERLPTVEINNTFYRMPKVETLESWSAQVPEDFRFSVKATRRITHIKRLKEPADETRYLLKSLEALHEQLGVILFQLPPNMKKNLERLQNFSGLLPEGTPAVFEFRHESWFDEEIYECLRARNFALCVADTEDGSSPFVSTASRGYLRLRRVVYSDNELKKWVTGIKAQNWDEAYVFFKHEDEATGPALARRFMELWSAK